MTDIIPFLIVIGVIAFSLVGKAFSTISKKQGQAGGRRGTQPPQGARSLRTDRLCLIPTRQVGLLPNSQNFQTFPLKNGFLENTSRKALFPQPPSTTGYMENQSM